MNNLTDQNSTPTPDEVTSDDIQGSTPSLNATHLDTATLSGGLESHSLSNSLHQLGNYESNKYKIQSLLTMAAQWAEDVNVQCRALQISVTKLNEREDILRNDLSVTKQENAALKEGIRVRNTYKPLMGAALFGAPVLASLGLDQIKTGSYGVGIVLITIGAILIFAVYATYTKGDKQ